MAMMDTKKVFDLYFNQVPQRIAKKSRPQVDRPEVYAYEIKLGKQIFDMDVDELFGLVLSFNKQRNLGESNFSISYSSYDQIASTYRSIWNFYIDNIEVIKNPWNNRKMRGVAATKRLAESKVAFSYDIVENVINKIHEEYNGDKYMNDYGDYLECLLLLFYNGFAEAREIVLLKEDDINFKTHEIRLPGRTVHLSDRCFELLEYIHNSQKMKNRKTSVTLVSYHDGYFKIPIRPSEVKSFQDKPLAEIAAIVTRKITSNMKQKYGIDINYRIVYLLGFYDYIVSKAGEERTRTLITSVRNSADARELMKYAKEYGVIGDNVSYIKKLLRPFLE